MLRFSVISDEVSQDLLRVIDFARRFNLQKIELRTLWDLPPQGLLERASELTEALNSNDLGICAIASPVFKSDIDSESEYREHIRILRDVIKLARLCDTRLVRAFGFWKAGTYQDRVDKMLRRFEEPVHIVEDEGMTLCVENEPSTILTNGRLVADFLRRLDSDSVKALWDPGNDMADPEAEVPYPDGYCFVKEMVAHIHVKDGIRAGQGGTAEFLAFGEGEVNYLAQLSTLIEDGFKGFLSLETHWRPSARLTESQVSKPGGDEFSKEGFMASEICMKNMNDLLRRAEGFARGPGLAQRH